MIEWTRQPENKSQPFSPKGLPSVAGCLYVIRGVSNKMEAKNPRKPYPIRL
ncbi:hypothetical protein GCWU000324_01416 [Kingella oralis ATCC 51147]|uniref:Uncharacterized protein n=1 Tax=Kingella oralis ATCC 51147 TaxID=629741 RepID=C4GGZ7_9NEIS|nr:hypothetical protein GCWU000324_01416 [Kingella oralis ATCC 51147]